MNKTNYMKYRGKCKIFVDEMVKNNPELKAARGYYHCPILGKQNHWWCVDKTGKIHDPTVKQFPTGGAGAEYEEFNGYLECEECGKEISEDEVIAAGNYPVCSQKCYGLLVGVSINKWSK